MHSITAKLNKTARTHAGDKGVTFFVNLGEKNYNYRTKENVWTNYDAALFASGAQVKFYEDILVEGAIITVSAKGILVETSEQYAPKLILNDAWLAFAMNDIKAAATHNQGMQQAHNTMNQQQSPPPIAPLNNQGEMCPGCGYEVSNCQCLPF